MGKWQQKILLILTIVSLTVLGTVVTEGYIKNRMRQNIKDPFTAVLGETDSQKILGNSTTFSAFFQDTISNTKEVVSEKVIEVERNILSSIQNEIQQLSQSQIQSLKLQICTDLGVISQPSPKP